MRVCVRARGHAHEISVGCDDVCSRDWRGEEKGKRKRFVSNIKKPVLAKVCDYVCWYFYGRCPCGESYI